MKRGKLLRRMEELELAMFHRLITILLNKQNGLLLVDDELIASRAEDVESKSLSNRKSGKERPVADCVACSFTSVMHGLIFACER